MEEVAMVAKIALKSCVGALICTGLLTAPNRAVAQYTQWFTVDCSGNTPGAYTSINAVMPLLTDRSGIYLVPGTACNEAVTLSRFNNIWLGTLAGSSATLNGTLDIEFSDSIYVQSLTMHSPSGDGISVNDSRAVVFDSCSSSGNPGNGLTVSDGSTVTVQAYGSYDFNGATGIYVSLNSTLHLLAWGGLLDLSSNGQRGLYIDRSVFDNLGNLSITDNGGDYGLDMEGRSTGLVMPIFGSNIISNNPGGGIHFAEDSQLSLGGWAPYTNVVQGNGPVGIAVGYGGQLTLFGQTQIQDHSSAGIDVYGNSQLAILSGVPNQITHNGIGTDTARAGIRIDGNSQAYVRDAVITQNGGPGILERVNSSVDVATSTLSSNAGGPIVCDGSAVLVSDLPPSALSSANSCKVGGPPGHHNRNASLNVPNWKQQKALSDKMHAMVAKLHH
jgi:hypothetical protein